MNQKTRDDVIYLAVGLGIVALIVVDLVYEDVHGRSMWVPSRFASRAAYSTVLLAYFVARDTRKTHATPIQVLGCLLFAGIVQLLVMFTLREAVSELPGLSFAALAVPEMFFVFQLVMLGLRYLRSK
jgi:hypothetical protein